MESKNLVNVAFDVVEPEDLATIAEKPPIIFLHGMISDRTVWKNVIRPIAAATGRKAYAIDARNHGDSGWSEEMTYGILQEDLLHFMDDLHAPKAILIGHSMGGKTAMFFATNKPDRVEKLIVEDMPPRPQTRAINAIFVEYVKLLESAVEKIPPEVRSLEDAKNFVKNFVDAFLPQQKPRDEQSSSDGGTDASTLPSLRQGEDGRFKWKTNMKVAADRVKSDISEIKGRCTIPTLMIYSTKSPYKVGSQIDFIRRVFPNSRIRALEGATHQIHLEHEDIFVKEVTEFINDC